MSVDAADQFVVDIKALVLSPDEPSLFWACFTEDAGAVRRILAAHSTLTLYTITSWGEEVWAHRGKRAVDRMGYCIGAHDLGTNSARRLWDQVLLDD